MCPTSPGRVAYPGDGVAADDDRGRDPRTERHEDEVLLEKAQRRLTDS